jgi:hypothetical protein
MRVFFIKKKKRRLVREEQVELAATVTVTVTVMHDLFQFRMTVCATNVTVTVAELFS